MAAVELETRVAAWPASVLEELENIKVVSEAVGTAPMGPNAAPGRAGRIINQLQCWGSELCGIRQLSSRMYITATARA